MHHLFLLFTLYLSPGAFIFFITATLIGLLVLTNLSIKNFGIQIFKFLRLNQAVRLFLTFEFNVRKKKEIILSSSIDDSYNQTSKNKIVDTPEPEMNIKQSISDEDIKIVDFQAAENESKANKKPLQIDAMSSKDSELTIHQESLPYMIPPVTLLNEPSPNKVSVSTEKAVRNNARLLEDTLNSFGVSAKVIQVSRSRLLPGMSYSLLQVLRLAELSA